MHNATLANNGTGTLTAGSQLSWLRIATVATERIRSIVRANRLLKNIAVAFVCLTLSSCDILGFHHWKWHQKLTVVVDTPNGPKTGSSVVEVTLRINPKWAGLGDSAGSAKQTLKGEAVAVEVQPGRYLFALLNDYSGSTAIEAFGIGRKPGGLAKDEYFARLDAFEKSRQTITLPADKYPLLVSFRNLSDPMSVVAAGPVSFKGLDLPPVAKPRDLSGIFGPGYSIRSIALSTVDDEITKGVIDPILPWLDGYRDKLFDGNTIHTINATNRLANSLGAGSFRTGMN